MPLFDVSICVICHPSSTPRSPPPTHPRPHHPVTVLARAAEQHESRRCDGRSSTELFTTVLSAARRQRWVVTATSAPRRSVRPCEQFVDRRVVAATAGRRRLTADETTTDPGDLDRRPCPGRRHSFRSGADGDLQKLPHSLTRRTRIVRSFGWTIGCHWSVLASVLSPVSPPCLVLVPFSRIPPHRCPPWSQPARGVLLYGRRYFSLARCSSRQLELFRPFARLQLSIESYARRSRENVC